MSRRKAIPATTSPRSPSTHRRKSSYIIFRPNWAGIAAVCFGFFGMVFLISLATTNGFVIGASGDVKPIVVYVEPTLDAAQVALMTVSAEDAQNHIERSGADTEAHQAIAESTRTAAENSAGLDQVFSTATAEAIALVIESDRMYATATAEALTLQSEEHLAHKQLNYEARADLQRGAVASVVGVFGFAGIVVCVVLGFGAFYFAPIERLEAVGRSKPKRKTKSKKAGKAAGTRKPTGKAKATKQADTGERFNLFAWLFWRGHALLGKFLDGLKWFLLLFFPSEVDGYEDGIETGVEDDEESSAEETEPEQPEDIHIIEVNENLVLRFDTDEYKFLLHAAKCLAGGASMSRAGLKMQPSDYKQLRKLLIDRKFAKAGKQNSTVLTEVGKAFFDAVLAYQSEAGAD